MPPVLTSRLGIFWYRHPHHRFTTFCTSTARRYPLLAFRIRLLLFQCQFPCLRFSVPQVGTTGPIPARITALTVRRIFTAAIGPMEPGSGFQASGWSAGTMNIRTGKELGRQAIGLVGDVENAQRARFPRA